MRRLIFLAACFSVGCAVTSSASDDGKAFVEAGLPAISREWMGDDYVRAAEVLAAGKVQLPHLSDAQGRLLLQRLTATENLSFCRNRTLPLEQRLDGLFKLMGGSNAISKQYMAAANKGANVHTELAQQLAFLLRVAVLGVQLVDEFQPTIPKDEKYAVRMDGLKQIYSGLTTMFAGAETSLSEKKFYSAEDLSLLLTAMAETLPIVKKAFASDYKLELRKKLESRRAAFPQSEDAQKLQRMISELAD